jgi:putative ABC transport system ATP-binding protein
MSGNIAVNAVNGVSLEVARGEFIVIVGPSGCGKSTLLNLIGAVDRPTAGTIIVDSVDLSTKRERELANFRRDKIGFVFQFFNLIQTLTASENIELPLRLKKVAPAICKRRVNFLLESVELVDKADRFPSALSGGEQQRVAIARALANDPAVVLLDEPIGNLDMEAGRKIMRLLRKLNKRENKTFILVTHEPRLAKYGDRVVKMRDGKLYNHQ